MKLNLLEDGVLDYKGEAATLATPNGANMTPVNMTTDKLTKSKSKFEAHVDQCPQCSKNKLCEIGRRLTY